MKTYCVQFWYNTDCRAEVLVSASNAVCAIAIAETKVGGLENWVENGKQYYVKVKLG